MKLKGISDKGLRRIAQESVEEYDQWEAHEHVNSALQELREVQYAILSEGGSNLLNDACLALIEFTENTDTVFK